MTFLSTAMFALRPAHNFRVINDTELIWEDARPQPTESEINAKTVELQADYDSKQYQRDRADAYPSLEDQLDNIFHNGINAWKADIQAIKDQFPKP
jgi:hypothetical protein